MVANTNPGNVMAGRISTNHTWVMIAASNGNMNTITHAMIKLMSWFLHNGLIIISFSFSLPQIED